jgi:Protein of unknown function (DUF3887)
LAQDQLDGVEQKIIQAMNNGDSASLESLFNPAMRDAVSEPKIKEVLAYVQQQFGKIVKTESSSRPAPGSVVYRIRFERGPADLNLVLDGSGQIAGLRIVPVTDKSTRPSSACPLAQTVDAYRYLESNAAQVGKVVITVP